MEDADKHKYLDFLLYFPAFKIITCCYVKHLWLEWTILWRTCPVDIILIV